MWRCSHCQETLEETFDVCWNCGTTKAGQTDAEFRSEPADPLVPDPGPDSEDAPVEILASDSGSSGMNRQEIAFLVCRTIALVIFAQTAFLGVATILLLCFSFFSLPFRGWANWHEVYAALLLSIPLLATIVVGVAYWKKAKSLASKMVSQDPTPVTTLAVTVQDVMMVAFSTAGVFILVDGVRDLVGFVYLAWDASFIASEFWNSYHLWSALIELGFASWLILGSRGIVQGIHRLRTAGVPDAEGEPPAQQDAQ